MATQFASDPRDRLKGAAIAIVVQAAIGYLLVVGLNMKMPAVIDDGLKTFGVLPPAPPPPPERIKPRPQKSKRPEGAAAPPNLRSRATEVTAPKPIVLPVIPPPIVAAVKPGTGMEATSGNADIVGPGTGAGGIGNGTGSGRYGDGDGDGGETPPRRIKGRLKDTDYPHDASERGAGGRVSVRYVVAVDGRVPACEVTRSSGDRELDATTCRLIRERYRFKPSLDADGRPVESVVTENHEWIFEQLPPDEDDRQ